MEPYVLVQRSESSVVLLTLNRPDALNVLSTEEQARELADTLAALDRDSEVRALVLTGAGKAFCAGGDLHAMRDGTGMFAKRPLDVRDAYRNGVQQVALRMMSMSVPVIAAINGPAVGAGLDIACMCDVRIGSERATFAESFVNVGVVSGDGGAWLLQRIVGGSRALQMSLTGDPIGAEKACSWGLLSEVVAAAELVPTAVRLASRIASNPPRAVRLTKQLIRSAQASTLAETLELSAAYQALCHDTEDHKRAVNALLERRSAIYTGQ